MTIRLLRSDEHELIGKIIGETFFDDPVYNFLVGSKSAITAYNTFAAKKLYLKHGFGHVTEDLSCGSLWLNPGVSAHLSTFQSLPILPALL